MSRGSRRGSDRVSGWVKPPLGETEHSLFGRIETNLYFALRPQQLVTVMDSAVSSAMETRTARIAFGSCNRQNLPQSHWNTISERSQPTHWLWIGDAVYAKNNKIPGLHYAYQQLLSNANYSGFSSQVHVDGVWDDHDYGVNDAGNNVKDRRVRQVLYEDFIKGHFLDATRYTETESVRNGLYHDLDISMGNKVVKVVFLDTRSFRDNHWLPSLGQVKQIPLSAIIASAIRGSYSVVGLGRSYSGKVLGEEQWNWLESTLASSTADMHIVVSSIQIMTSNPVVESWGHFPVEKKRLFSLFQRTNPKGLVMLSGDVHMGELSKTSFVREDGSHGEWVEITSSGMTHTCSKGSINKILCPLMVRLFSSHRYSAESVLLDKNYGVIEMSADHEQLVTNVTISVRSLDNDERFLSYSFLYGNSLNHKSTESNILLATFVSESGGIVANTDVPDFYQMPLSITLSLVAVLASIILWVMRVHRK